MANKTFIKEAAQKLENGNMDSYVPFGVSFEDVINTNDPSGKHYSLAQFFKNYMDFIQNTDFVYTGPEAPTNSHIKIWIDTSPNQ